MSRIGFHASHEQISPQQLLDDVQRAEAAGFDAAMCSDHIEPWSHAQGHSGFAWSWLGAALGATRFPMGVVTVPGYRYHPVVLAHAAATLGTMFPGRFWFAPGSGEHLNERVTGQPWPPKEVRQVVLEEAIDIIGRLMRGETVTHHRHIRTSEARLWDLPGTPVPVLIPALTPETAHRFAPLVDGLITVNQPLDGLKGVLEAFRERNPSGRAVLQVHLSWAETAEEAWHIAHDQWRTNVLDPPEMAELSAPEQFEERSKYVSDHTLEQSVNISPDLGRHAEWIRQYAELGFDEIYLHHVGQKQARFIDVFGEHVLPQFAA
ncbi:TIGR03885 family FMN-dependent LLM class oxidoreductase [Hoyosella subflava]|uniref:Putative dehydrogenase protein n=1 Tax=Hoyosella subflava (strain DSM 45089 / JCM 17490 / NBRC 109087 / DQS3-9A1) TaxID=443218 RepID=F6EGD6_HOYSD|nr:TIGR03885 family FMN-dependent LLM class oxidoreductase [Hoyosella subflava]AEF39861.1 Putative dehydrogenase protein [Hoyosella subflava DQS3-9A1]